MKDEHEKIAWLAFILLVMTLVVGMIAGFIIGVKYNSCSASKDFADTYKVDTLHSQIK